MATQQGFDLQPRSIGELLDLTFRIYRRRFAVFAALGIAISALIAVVGTLIQFLFVDPEVWSDLQEPESALVAIARIYAFLGLASLVNVFLYGLGMMAITAAAEDTLLGRPTGPSLAISKSWRRSVWAGVASVMVMLCIVVGAMACILPAIPVTIVLILAVPLIYLERKRPIAAMGRSYELVMKRGSRSLSIESNWARILVVGFVTLIVVYLLSIISSLPLLIASGTAALRGGGLTPTPLGLQPLPLHTLLPLQLVGALFHGTFLSIGIIPWTVMYYDIRTRHEGLDLELQLESLAGALRASDS